MDVRCTQCGVEYEFDDTKVKATGVTVKCTSCGHVFKVKPGGVVPEEPVAPATGDDAWTVRTADGTTLRFKELTTLQKWIVEQKVGRADQISKTGTSWKPLGEIAELASFFQVVDAARAAQAQPQTPTPAPTPTPVPAPAPANVAVPPVVAVAPPKGEPTPPPGDTGPTAPGAQPPSVSGEFYAGAELSELDDEDPVLQWRRRARMRNAGLFVVVLAIGALATLFFAARPTFDRVFGDVLARVGIAPSKTVDTGPDAVVERVDELLLTDDALAGDELIAELTPLLVADDAPVARVAALARLHAGSARRGFDAARLLRAVGGAAAATADGAQGKADEHLAAGYKLANRARSLDAASPEADLAFAAYQAAKGATAELKADLAGVREKAPASARAGLRAEADALSRLGSVVAALNEGEAAAMSSALSALAGADARDQRLVVGRLLLQARVAADDAARVALRADVQAAAAARPGDTRLALLLASLPEAVAAAPSDAGPGTEVAATEGAAPTPDEEAPAATKPAAASGAPSYGALMKKAERNRVRDRARAALKLYQQAVELKPTAAKPHAGLGWCYLDMGQSRRAISSFNDAIDRAPGLAEAYFGRAEAQREVGSKTAAKVSYQRYLELAPSGPDAAVARNALKSLE